MRWYYYLNRKGEENLVERETIEEDDIIVSRWTREKKYTLVKGHISLYETIKNSPDSEKCFFEVLFPETKRKPYFDIDIEGVEFDEEILFSEIRYAIQDLTYPDVTIMVYSSHRPGKKSYHVVVDKIYLENYESCQIFYKKVLDKISLKYRDFFDESVYKSTQQFRILGCQKYEKQNYKKLNPKLSCNFKIPYRYKNDRGKNLYTLLCSLVGRTERCKYLPGFEPPKKEMKTFIGTSSEDDLDDVISVFKENFNIDNFKIGKIVEREGSLIICLKTLVPYMCGICKRVHDLENPFLSVRGTEREIYFYCRRNKKDKFYLGKLGVPPNFSPVRKSKTPDLIPEIKNPSPTRVKDLQNIKVKKPKPPRVNTSLKLSLY